VVLVDSSVVLEAMKPQGNPAVRSWLNRQQPETLFISATSLCELLSTVLSLPSDRKRRKVFPIFDDLSERLFKGRVLSFDAEASLVCAGLIAKLNAIGEPISHADAQNAAIAAIHDYAIVALDTRPFRAAGVDVLNPWQE